MTKTRRVKSPNMHFPCTLCKNTVKAPCADNQHAYCELHLCHTLPVISFQNFYMTQKFVWRARRPNMFALLSYSVLHSRLLFCHTLLIKFPRPIHVSKICTSGQTTIICFPCLVTASSIHG